MPKKIKLWPWKRHEKYPRPPKQSLLKGVWIGNAGDPEVGEDIPIIMGERFDHSGLSSLNGEIHAKYHEQLKRQTYRGEAYIVNMNYQEPRFHTPLCLPTGRPAYGAPDGRTRKLIRDLKHFEDLRGEFSRSQVVAQMKRYVQLHKLEYGCAPQKVIIDWW